MSVCGAKHPDEDARCVSQTENHPQHFTWQYNWPNPDFRPPAQKMPTTAIRDAMYSAALRIRGRRNEPR